LRRYLRCRSFALDFAAGRNLAAARDVGLLTPDQKQEEAQE
jgi:hypothetical protein